MLRFGPPRCGASVRMIADTSDRFSEFASSAGAENFEQG
jgi:hypothetical protein